MKTYYNYAQEVLDGKIVVGDYVKLACKRFLTDLDRDDLIFKEKKVDRAIEFIGTLKHYTGRHSGKPFNLEPFQQFIVANIVGFYWKDTNTRRFTSSYIEIARKNGKTALAAALCLYFLLADGEDGAEVVLAANSKEQAKIAFTMASLFAKGIDPKDKHFRRQRSDIFFDRTNSVLKVLAADDTKLDGFNASFGLLDEYHAAANSKVRDVIKSSMGMRENPHLCTITTAGFDKSKPCYKLREVAIEVLNNIKEDDSMFICIFSLDVEDDWQEEINWIKANPNLNVTVRIPYLKDQIQQAKNNPSDEVGVRTKNLNQWCDSASVWIADDYVIRCVSKFELEDFKGEQCYIGVDLSAVSDLTAVSYLVVKDDKYYFKTHYYLPEAALNDKSNKELYKDWSRRGILTITTGNVTDYDYITNDIIKASKIVKIRKIAYDEYNSTQWAIDCTSKRLPLEPYSQSLANFNKPTKELERLILSNTTIIDNNEITLYCFRNVKLKADHNENVKPIKSQDQSKIDGCISMIQALGIFLMQPRYTGKIYKV